MSDIRGVGKTITYAEDNPVGQWTDNFRKQREKLKREPQFAEEYGLRRNIEHWELQTRDFLSYLIAGNMWPYGHCTASTIQSILITTPKVLDFEERVVHAEEQGHHDAALQKLHDTVWELID